MDPTSLFTELFGERPDGVWSAPGRVNLIGEHTDYNNGLVLPFAIDLRTRVAARLRSDRTLRMASTAGAKTVEVSLDDLAPGLTRDWTAYVWGTAWALGAHEDCHRDRRGLDLLVDSDVPVGSGLSSSAALESAVALALHDLWNLPHSRMELAKAGRTAENEAVGAPTGLMDQVATLLSTTDHAVLLDCRDEQARAIPLSMEASGLTVLVIDTRVAHSHATGGYRERRASCEHGAATLGVATLRELTASDLPRAASALDEETYRRVRHVVTENARVEQCVELLASHGPRAIGDLLVASHVSLRDDFEVSVPELDLAVETACAAGAIGARMTGGGFGGCAIAVIDKDKAHAVADAVARAFSRAGFEAPCTFTVAPSDGAHRDDDVRVEATGRA